MNNEEKILSALENLQQDMSGLKTDVSELKADMVEVKADVSNLKTDVLRISVIQENEVLPRIQLLAEGHSGLVQRLDELADLPEKVDDIQETVSVLKYAFKEHTQAKQH